MDDAVARALKLQAAKVAIGLLVMGGVLGARILSVRSAEARAPEAALSEESAARVPVASRDVERSPSAPAESALWQSDDGDQADVEADRPGRCEVPAQGIQFMRAADCRGLGGSFIPLQPKKP